MKQCIGIDVSKSKLQVALLQQPESVIKVKSSCTFNNDLEGFRNLIKWVKEKTGKESAPPHYVLEATGVYHEHITDFLHEKGNIVSVVKPNSVKYFANSLNIKTKTDKVDAKVIAHYGLVMSPVAWQPMSKNFTELRSISRALSVAKKDLTRAKNRLAAYTTSKYTSKLVLSKNKREIARLENDIKEYTKALLTISSNDPEFDKRVDNVSTIRGISKLSVIRVLCEYNGFLLCENIRQAVSYAGLDVVDYQSGTINKPGHISRKGNARIREILVMCALSASTKGNEPNKALYQRVASKNPNAKRKGLVAVARKLVVLIYTLWKKNEPYNIDFDRVVVD